MNVEITTPEKTLFIGDAELVQLPGIDGSFEILNNHAPLVSVLKKGNVRMKFSSKKEKLIPIESGVIQVKDNVVLILAE